ncbi:MAG TPA: tryptophan--tRNA ligase [Patescibacteria group bacterium]|nr:tryptophan--tRNA ligase [Patescibacteria group bacterium]
MAKPVILTGIRSNGELTLGNYLGAILPTIELQSKHAGKYQVNMFVPDLHSFTTPVEHGRLYQNTLDNLKLFVAAGLDIQNADTYIYRQSYIPAHSELTWILDCFIGMGELERMTQYKSKSRQLYGENVEQYSSELANEPNFAEMKAKQVKIMDEVAYRISVGLFNYPALMAADILLYGAKYIPVGEDQRQHIELTRDVAIRMNNKFDKLFVVPEDWDKQVEFANRAAGVRIRSLRSPEKKMSKSVEDPAGTILLTDSPDSAAKKVTSATTDNEGSIRYNFEKQPGVSNLLQISALLAKRPVEDAAKDWEGKNSYGELKSQVAEQVKTFLSDLQTKYAAVDESSLQAKLEQDEVAMRKVADETLLRVQKAVGLRPA